MVSIDALKVRSKETADKEGSLRLDLDVLVLLSEVVVYALLLEDDD